MLMIKISEHCQPEHDSEVSSDARFCNLSQTNIITVGCFSVVVKSSPAD